MLYAILIALSLILFGGFFVLVAFERKRGLRVAGMLRNKLDKRVARIAFIVRHVDWGAFVKHLTSSTTERILHDIAHGILRFVRTTERLLTRLVKTLRERRGIPAEEPEEGMSPLAAGLRKMRAALRSSRKRPQE